MGDVVHTEEESLPVASTDEDNITYILPDTDFSSDSPDGDQTDATPSETDNLGRVLIIKTEPCSPAPAEQEEAETPRPPADHHYCRTSGEWKEKDTRSPVTVTTSVLASKGELAMLRCPFCPAILVTELRFYNHLSSRHASQPPTDAIQEEVDRYRAVPRDAPSRDKSSSGRSISDTLLHVPYTAESFPCHECPAILVTKRRFNHHLRTVHNIRYSCVRR